MRIFDAISQLVKNIIILIYSVIFLIAENRFLRKTNEAFNKRRKAKKNVYLFWRITYRRGKR